MRKYLGRIPQAFYKTFTLKRHQMSNKVGVIYLRPKKNKISIIEERQHKIASEEDKDKPDHRSVFSKKLEQTEALFYTNL